MMGLQPHINYASLTYNNGNKSVNALPHFSASIYDNIFLSHMYIFIHGTGYMYTKFVM